MGLERQRLYTRAVRMADKDHQHLRSQVMHRCFQGQATSDPQQRQHCHLQAYTFQPSQRVAPVLDWLPLDEAKDRLCFNHWFSDPG